MDSFLSPTLNMGFRNYFDDIAVATSDLQQIPKLLNELVNRAIKVGATFKLSSLQIGGQATYFAGLKCDENGVHAPSLQLAKLANLEIPNTEKGLRSYMGVLNYLDKFFPPKLVLSLKECVPPF